MMKNVKRLISKNNIEAFQEIERIARYQQSRIKNKKRIPRDALKLIMRYALDIYDSIED